jgi:hypothetical protein
MDALEKCGPGLANEEVEPEWRTRQSSTGEVQLAPEVASMLVRLARELRVSAEPLDLDLGARTEESGHAQA